MIGIERRVRGEDRLRRAASGRRAGRSPPSPPVLDDRLDHQVGGQRASSTGSIAAEHLVGVGAALLGELRRGCGASSRGRARRRPARVVERDAPARRGDDLRDAGAHLPGADDENVLEASWRAEAIASPRADASLRDVSRVRPWSRPRGRSKVNRKRDSSSTGQREPIGARLRRRRRQNEYASTASKVGEADRELQPLALLRRSAASSSPAVVCAQRLDAQPPPARVSSTPTASSPAATAAGRTAPSSARCAPSTRARQLALDPLVDLELVARPAHGRSSRPTNAASAASSRRSTGDAGRARARERVARPPPKRGREQRRARRRRIRPRAAARRPGRRPSRSRPGRARRRSGAARAPSCRRCARRTRRSDGRARPRRR